MRKSDTSLIGPPTFQRTGSDLLLENKLSRDLDLIGPKEWELRVEASKPPAAVIGARPDFRASVLFCTNSHKFDNFVQFVFELFQRLTVDKCFCSVSFRCS